MIKSGVFCGPDQAGQNSELFERAEGEVSPPAVALRWELCNDAIVLSTSPLTIRMPRQQWSYGLLLPLDPRAMPAQPQGVVVRLRLAVRNGMIGVAGVEAGLAVLTTAEQVVGDGEITVRLALDDARKTAAIFLRTVSADGRSPDLTLLSAATEVAAEMRLVRRRHDLDHDLFVILAMPKTATQTVERTLLALAPSVPVRRIHFISSRSVGYVRTEMQSPPLPDTVVRSTLRQATLGEETRSEIELVRSLGGRVALISAIREPIDQIVASIFQSIPDMIPAFAVFSASGSRLLDLLREFAIHEMRRAAAGIPPWRSPRAFFRDELAPVSRVDILRHPIDHPKGSVLVANEGVTTLIYRFEDAGLRLAPALSAVTGRAGIELVSTNRSSDKDYAKLYSEFRASLRVPDDVCSALYDQDPYVRHFYSDAEISEFKAKWSEPRVRRPHPPASAAGLKLSVRKVVLDGPGIVTEMDRFHVTERLPFDPATSVLVVMDPWSSHPVPGHLERIRANMRTSLVPLLDLARATGLQISYHPTTGDIDALVSPQRCDWVIDWQHYDQSDGDELARRCAVGGRAQLLYAGYAVNMCIFNKPAGVLEMSRKGFRDIIVVRDATIGSEMPDTLGNEYFKQWALFEVERKYGCTTTIADLRDCLSRGAGAELPREGI
jgi:Putative capsular polysaccharide synthesis protein